MRIFISYKYSNIKDKAQLKDELLEVSDILESFGHETFLLARDVQNWNNKGHSLHSRFSIPAREIRKADGIFVYLNSSVLSPGLLFEIHWAKLFGKKIILAIKEGVRSSYLHKLASEKAIVFKNFAELKAGLK
ncbi:hypothetical protein A2886_02990 [candidate division WWE3 bacterium RIFCSPHIGHO2_01_FULL_42_13]|uniref:Nucleoside 2-deoxyribosyltransferase n=1 Tax=candidate division WWE3 bacterium RIFCSPHIGHO2_01_FULL_42_13 TaxID=1802617 RepID=A0A1F4USE2_UNCKA|nr:MAG: hypothetical protein A2886_02990 [candidate division WWE3 bacterium RIFCSPHIGHO2_01_FULL_42_13]